uniref:ATP synthase F0 subunit 8 n=1 Tax=Xestocephalus iguchii TaxID=3112138 RepID=UPI002E7678BD|nr:ATP synthase F0 subunit 8 [Xestocephalus iguchii]WRK21313.1 ATP synthase F0 subunit 8 [Xestocephalus iguchii]
MPQMSPMWWMFMMTTIMTLMMMTNSIMYFYTMTNKLKTNKMNKTTMNWKW